MTVKQEIKNILAESGINGKQAIQLAQQLERLTEDKAKLMCIFFEDLIAIKTAKANEFMKKNAFVGKVLVNRKKELEQEIESIKTKDF